MQEYETDDIATDSNEKQIAKAEKLVKVKAVASKK